MEKKETIKVLVQALELLEEIDDDDCHNISMARAGLIIAIQYARQPYGN